jgi:hypothetical protein
VIQSREKIRFRCNTLQKESVNFKAFYGDGTSHVATSTEGYIKRSSQEQIDLSQLILVSKNGRLIPCRIGRTVEDSLLGTLND